MIAVEKTCSIFMSLEVIVFYGYIIDTTNEIFHVSPKTLDALNNFVLERDKSYPPTFVGRKDVINTIRDMSELVYMKYKNDSFQPAATQLVHGAPGAGKSSLLMHLQKAVAWKDFKDIYGTSRPDPLVLYLAGPEGFTDLNSFGHELKTCLT